MKMEIVGSRASEPISRVISAVREMILTAYDDSPVREEAQLLST